MTDLEKREKLKAFCDAHHCTNCPLRIPTLRCGRGTTFLKKKYDNDDTEFDMSEEEINVAYAIAFPEPEPVMTELVEERPDTLITIAITGERKVSNIEIYFKED